ncbi:MAG: DMT family transporter, partial [Verrucomicrobiota bacterium]
VAGFAFAAFFHRHLRPHTFAEIKPESWRLLLLLAVLEGAIAPTLIFLALSEIPVASVVLVQSIKVPLILLLAWWLRRERPSFLSLTGAGVAVGGIALMILLKPSAGLAGIPWGWHEGKVALASFLFVFATQLRRRLGPDLPLGIYFLTRSAVGGLVFALLVLALFGPSHFTDIWKPFLWKWMLVYGLLVVAAGQITWQIAIRSVGAAEVSASEAATPVLGILFAFLLLHQPPTSAEWLGGLIVIAGMSITLWGARKGTGLSQTTTILSKPGPGPFTGI